MNLAGILRRIARDRHASMAIETAIVAPVLIMMTLGVVDVGSLVARQHELQTAANESEIIILATNQGAETDIATIKSILQQSVNLPSSKVSVSRNYRCGTNTLKVLILNLCPSSEVASSYIVIDISDTYVPTWTSFGVGQPISLSVKRSIQVS